MHRIRRPSEELEGIQEGQVYDESGLEPDPYATKDDPFACDRYQCWPPA